MHPRCCRPVTSWVHYTTSCNTQSSAPEDGQSNCPKHVELTGIINKPFLLHLVSCLYYLYQRCTVKQISDTEIYLSIKYIKSVLWRIAKRLSYTEDARCLKVNMLVGLNYNDTSQNPRFHSLSNSKLLQVAFFINNITTVLLEYIDPWHMLSWKVRIRFPLEAASYSRSKGSSATRIREPQNSILKKASNSPTWIRPELINITQKCTNRNVSILLYIFKDISVNRTLPKQYHHHLWSMTVLNHAIPFIRTLR